MIFQVGQSEGFPEICRIGSMEKREALPLNPSAAGCHISSSVEEAGRKESIRRGEEKRHGESWQHICP